MKPGELLHDDDDDREMTFAEQVREIVREGIASGDIDVNRALSVAAKLGMPDHIDIEAEWAALLAREDQRRALRMELLRKHPGHRMSTDEMLRYLREAGGFDGFNEDIMTGVTLELIRMTRAKCN